MPFGFILYENIKITWMKCSLRHAFWLYSISAKLLTLLPYWTSLPILTLLPNFGGFHRTLQRVWLANRGRLLLRTPGPVPIGTCICSYVETILSWTCHVYGPFEFRTSLGTSISLCTKLNLAMDDWWEFNTRNVCIVYMGTCKLRNGKKQKETKRNGKKKNEKKTRRKVTKRNAKKRKQNSEKRNETKEKEKKRKKRKETKRNEMYGSP